MSNKENLKNHTKKDGKILQMQYRIVTCRGFHLYIMTLMEVVTFEFLQEVDHHYHHLHEQDHTFM